MTGTPDTIGRYRILRRLGSGGIAEVFVAVRHGGVTPVALKRLLPQMHAHPNAEIRLKREANLSSLIDHPNVARVVGAGMEDGAFCIATELIDGKDIDTVLMEAPYLPIDLSVSLALSVLEALSAIHELTDPEGKPVGLVHRDLSPRNLMVGFDGKLKVIDFGIARAAVDQLRTSAGTLIGTPNYLSPEQAAGDQVDRRSDLYTVCVVLHEMLTGRRLVPETEVLAAVSKVLTERAPHPSDVNRAVPRALGDAVLKGLEKDPDRRWADARALHRALAGALPGKRWTEEKIAEFMLERFPDHVDPMPRTDDLPHEPTRASVEPPRRKDRKYAIAGALLLGALAVLIAIAPDQDPQPQPSSPVSQVPPPPPAAPTPTVLPRAVEEPPVLEDPAPPREAIARRPPAKPIAPQPAKPPPAKPIDPPAPPLADGELASLLAAAKASVEQGGLDNAISDRLLRIVGDRAIGTAQKNAARHAKLCMNTCLDDTAKIRALENAVESLRSQRP